MEMPVEELTEIGSLLALVVGMPPETNPAFMTDYLKALGVPTAVEVMDVGSLSDENLLKGPKTDLAVLCVFAEESGINKVREKRGPSKCEECARQKPDAFFVKTPLGKWSGTVAAIHAVANNPDKVILKAGAMKNFIDLNRQATPEKRGETLEKSEEILNIRRSVRKKFTERYMGVEYSDLTDVPEEVPALRSETPSHASTARKEKSETDSGEVGFKFICFALVHGHLLELDGALEGPFCHGQCAPDKLLKTASAKIKEYAGSSQEARFQAMVFSLGSAK